VTEHVPANNGLDEAEFSALMEKSGTVTPLLRGVLGKPDGKSSGRRETLLLALKPYLSPERCEMIEYLIRIGRIGDLLRSLS
jgi:hypothetical protein